MRQSEEEKETSDCSDKYSYNLLVLTQLASQGIKRRQV
ncbi:Uncharacterized protein dnm_051760 [Desulfonema magnum]|uniref:Uncharacterized protein n=1 Tax=Desulfonema magnum TaxID=45655 RepID=A0A975GQN3_9BACT|nr:Uncharacterized protein dnm_051760 [Desulfonema magnum]